MSSLQQLRLVMPERQPLLPPELVWALPVAPLPLAVLLIDDLLTGAGTAVAMQVFSVYLPFWVYAGFFIWLYRGVMPGWVRRIDSRLGRGLFHVAVVVLGTTLLAAALVPFTELLCGTQTDRLRFTAISIVISSAVVFSSMAVQRWRNEAHALEAVARAERQAAIEAQLMALQSRTNPHFFFNSINTVASLIPDDPALAERTLERLAELFRYALESGKTRTVSLKREMEMVEDYLEIQRARFGPRLSTSIRLDPEVAEVPVPPLMLQPLVENAILHGLSDRKQGRVEVWARAEGAQLVVSVTDDGPGPGASSHRGTRTSVGDLGQRLRLAFGDAARFTLSEAPGGGCCAFVAVPLPS